MFFKGAGDNFIAISVYVDDQTIIPRSLPPVISLKHVLASRFSIDDLTIISRSLCPVLSLKHALANRFGIDDLRETTYTLGLEV